MEHRFVFIGGLHRSGTTFLWRCMGEHPLVSMFPITLRPPAEGQLLQSVYPRASVYGGPGRFGFSPEAHLTEGSPLVSAESRMRLLADWAPLWDLDKPVLLEKSPPNLIRGRFLQALFPEPTARGSPVSTGQVRGSGRRPPAACPCPRGPV